MACAQNKFLLRPSRGAMHLSICCVSATTPMDRPSRNFCAIICSRGSVLLWRSCDTLCTSGFMDDVTFGRNGSHGDSGVAIRRRSLVSMNALFRFVIWDLVLKFLHNSPSKLYQYTDLSARSLPSGVEPSTVTVPSTLAQPRAVWRYATAWVSRNVSPNVLCAPLHISLSFYWNLFTLWRNELCRSGSTVLPTGLSNFY